MAKKKINTKRNAAKKISTKQKSGAVLRAKSAKTSGAKSGAMEMFAKKGAGEVYTAIVKKARARIGAKHVVEDLKGTCVHLNSAVSGTAFAGAHPRTGAVLVNIRVSRPIKSTRVRKLEQASSNRWHCEVLVSSEAEVDGELLGWLAEAHELASQ